MEPAIDASTLLGRLRRLGIEPSDVEVKAAVRGLPSSVPETISAFANGSGGTLLLGVDEGAGFTPSPGFDAGPIRDALADACANKVEPPCRAPIEVEEVDGAPVIRLDVPEIDPVEKPCFVTARGAYAGSFIRGGDGDRQLTRYEVTQLLSNRRQPTFDRETVDGAVMADLDVDLVSTYLARVRRNSPILRTHDDETLLIQLGVLARDGAGAIRPTLAGLLCLGTYPQQFFPQLFVSFVVLPRLRMGETGPDGRRFLDNKSLVGPIPTIVADAIAMAIKNMRAGAIITGIGREDRYDYPLDVIRELVVNALMHRDYSPDATGTQVQIELYPDRLVVKSPGGLYGPITVADLGSEDHSSTSRNRTLAMILADVEDVTDRRRALCENRGSGLLAVLAELRRVGMSPPQFDVAPGRMIVRLPQHALLAPEILEWIGTLGQEGLTDEQHLALAMMKASGRVTNATLRAWGVDRVAAGTALRDLVLRGLALRVGGRRYASYHLLDAPTAGAQVPRAAPLKPSAGLPDDLRVLLAAIRGGTDTSPGLQRQLGLPQRTVARRLSALVERGLIEPTRPRQSTKQSYRLVDREES
jgi:ATP-dependent DNA helicase RecG